MADKVTIVRSEKSSFTLKLRDSAGDPFDISAYDKYKVCIPADDGSVVEITEVANGNNSIVVLDGNAILGRLIVTINQVDTALLLEEERQDLQLVLDVAASAAPKIAVFKNVLTVLGNIC